MPGTPRHLRRKQRRSGGSRDGAKGVTLMRESTARMLPHAQRLLLLALGLGLLWTAAAFFLHIPAAGAAEDDDGGLLGTATSVVEGATGAVDEVAETTLDTAATVVAPVMETVTEPIAKQAPAPVADVVEAVPEVVTPVVESVKQTVTATTEVVDTGTGAVTGTVETVVNSGPVSGVTSPVVDLVSEVPIVGEAKEVLADMHALIPDNGERSNRKAIEKWWQRIKEWQGLKSLNYDRGSELIKPQFVIEKLFEVTGGDAYVTSDVGQHQMWAAQFYRFDQPRRWINSGGLGTMGFGLPGAIGACFASGRQRVICVAGDGGLQMSVQEIQTVVHYKLPITLFVLDNGGYMSIRWTQRHHYGREVCAGPESGQSSPDFVKIGEAYGILSMRINNQDDLSAGLDQALTVEEPLCRPTRRYHHLIH